MTTNIRSGNFHLPRLTDSNDFFKWRANSINLIMQKGPDIYDVIMFESPEPPQGTKEHREWHRYNLTAKGLLLSSMSTKLSTMVDHYPTAHQIWQHLEKSFSIKLRYRLEEIETEFNSLRQDKLTIASYAAKIMTMEQSFAIRDANGEIRPVTIVKDKIDKKVEYDDIVDQLKAKEIKLGLHVYGLSQQSRNSVSVFITNGRPKKFNNRSRNFNTQKGNSPPKGKPLEEVVCFKCKQKGHYANRCPNPQKEEGDETVMITDVVNPKLAYSSSDNGYGSANNWIINSASTVHICINKNLFTELSETITPPIQSGSLQHVLACGKGTIKVVANIGHKKTHTLVLKNVFYVPTYAANLISLNLISKVTSISINGSRLIARKGGNIIFKGETRNMLTYLCQPKPEFAALTYGAVSTSIWHQQLGHPGKGRMKQILEVIPEVAKETDMSSGKCHPLQLIHSNVVSKFKDIMPGGHQFAVTFINDYSRFVMVYLMVHKSEVLGHFQETRAILSSRNATFDEELFPFKEQDTPQIENTTTIDIHDEAPQEPVLIHPTPIRAISPNIVHPPSNNAPMFAQEEECVGFPYLTQEERDQGISTPPLEDFICSLSSAIQKELKGEPPLILTLYVDDVLIFAKHKPTVDKSISMLQSKFKMTGGDPVLFILGIQVTSTPMSLHLSQTSHIQHLLTQFGLDNVNIVHTPAIASDIADGVALNANDHSLYCTIIGSILYISTCTQPDIAFAVNRLSCYLASPTDKAMTAAKHLLRYLKGTANYGLLFTKKGTSFPPEEDWGPHLQTYSDADFGGDTATRKSTSGIANTINGMPYSWLSKRQPLVVTSTTYAEYITMAEACKEITWSRQLLAELSFEIHKPTPLYVDNQAAIYLSKDPKDHQRNKHINIKYHFIREKQLDGTIIVTNIPTSRQLADSLTKPLEKVKVSQHRQYLNIYPIQGI
uniref:CCHC-type domain-containing protein n=1 Tax=Ustilago esculenta TaxID=185366 RepID=A0A481SHS0_9BASI|nr:hypothetical protein UEMT_2080 [Ustilago esculenta]